MADDTERRPYSTLLVGDDDEDQLLALTDIFVDEGFDVVACSTGPQALECLCNEHIGVALVDLRLPDLSGIELLERLQSVTDRTQVIIHTAHGSYASAKDAVNLGAFAYVEKGCDPSELTDAVHRAFRTRLTRYARELEDAVVERTQELSDVNESLRCVAEKHKLTEEAYCTLVENSLQGLVILQDGRAVFANQTLADMLGCTVEEMLRMPHQELRQHVHSDDREWVWQRHEERIDGGTVPSRYELRLVHKDGEVRWVEIIASKTQFQRRPATQVAFLDITERKQAETVAREQQELAVALSSTMDFDEGLRLSVETALRVSSMDCGGVYLVNESAATLDLACSRGLSEDFIKVVAHYDRDSDHARLVMAGEPVYAEYDEVPVELSETEKREGLGSLAMLPIKHEGQMIGCLNVASRVSSEVPPFARAALETIAAQIGSSLARLRTEEETKELAQAAVELVRLVPTADIVSFICDKVGELAGDAIVGVTSIDEERGTLRVRKVIGVESEVLNMIDGLLEYRVSEGGFGGVHEEAMRNLASGKLRKLHGGLSEMFFGRVPKSLCDSIERNIGGRDVYSIGLVSMGKLLGNVTILPTAGVRLNGNAIEAFVNAASMALERKQAQEQLRQRDAELAHMGRLQTTSEMASGLAHEISQPLYAIVNYADGATRQLRDVSAQPEDLSHVMEKIARQARRASNVISRLRAFAEKREPHRSTTDLNQLIKDLLDLLEHELRQSGASVELNLTRELPDVLVDRVQIEQVLVNLIHNALDAMRDEPSTRRLTIATSADDDQAVEVCVADTGHGLSTEACSKLFDAFYTTKADGLGMGLAISRTIVEAHDGRIWATPNSPRGTIFRLTLPIMERKRAHAI